MDVRVSVLLLIAASCCSGLDITGLKFTGHFGDKSFLVTNTFFPDNKITGKVTAKETEFDKDIIFQITNNYDTSVFCKQTFKLTKTKPSLDINCQINIDLKADIQKAIGDGTITFEASATQAGTPPVKKTAHAAVPILDIKHLEPTSEKQTVTTTGCTVNLDIGYPFTFPKGRAECGVWNTDKKQFVKIDKVTGIYFDSNDDKSGWKTIDGPSKTSKKRQSLRLSASIDVTKLRGYPDLKKSKQIKCRLSWGDKGFTYSPETNHPIEVKNKADLCGPNELDELVKDNKNIELGYADEIKSCYNDKPVNTMSLYSCNYDKKEIGNFCDKNNKYQLSIDNGKFVPYDKATAQKFINHCLIEPKTLKVHPVVVNGDFDNVIQASGIGQTAMCAFDVGEEDMYADTVKATVIIKVQGEDKLPPQHIYIKKATVNETQQVVVDFDPKVFNLKAGTKAKLDCVVALEKFYKPHESSTNLEVIAIHDGPTKTDVKVDHENCEVDFNLLYRQPTNPKLLAFCGIWESKTSVYADGEWLEGPEVEVSEGLSFSSSRNNSHWAEHTSGDFTQYKLSNQKIEISHLDKDKYNWVKCEWMFPNSNSTDDDALISIFHSEIRAQNEADTCPVNPVDGKKKDVEKKGAKILVNVQKKSCYGDKVTRNIDMTVSCNNTPNFVTITCDKDHYVMKSAKTSKSVKYTDKDFNKFLEKCGAGSVFVSNMLMAVLMLVLFFKSN